MSKKTRKSTQLLLFGNYKWSHWIVVFSFLILGIITAIIPSLIANQIIIGSIIIGAIFIGIFIFCLIDYIIYTKKNKEKNNINSNKN